MVALQAVSRAESNQPVRLERIHDRIGKAGPSGPPGGQGQRCKPDSRDDRPGARSGAEEPAPLRAPPRASHPAGET